MALDPALADQLTTNLLTNAQLAGARINAIADASVQGLNVVQACRSNRRLVVRKSPL